MTFRDRVETGFSLLMCEDCGAAVVDSPDSLDLHEAFHQNLTVLVTEATQHGVSGLAQPDA